MSGRDLFTYDASLFKDEEGAVSADEYDEREEAQLTCTFCASLLPPIQYPFPQRTLSMTMMTARPMV